VMQASPPGFPATPGATLETLSAEGWRNPTTVRRRLIRHADPLRPPPGAGRPRRACSAR
jgi:hypothetical protein